MMAGADERIRGLAGAAGHLCCAYDELAAVGCTALAVELDALIESIEVEIVCLEEWEQEETRRVPHY